jgi:protein-disulfide isomerase
MSKKENNNILMSVIIALLVIVAILLFFLGKNYNNVFNTGNNWANVQAKDVELTVIGDKRCSNCQTEEIILKLTQIPALSVAKIERKDFSDAWVEQYLKDNNITTLPAILFNNSQIDPNINNYLTAIPSGEYSLQIWATFDPFAKRSERWFLMLDKTILSDIKEKSYIKWNPEAKITWIEYSDLECPFCAKLHNNGTPKELQKKYGNDLNLAFNHFPLDFHKNALSWAQILECVWEEKWVNVFYSLIEKSFSEKNSDKNFLIKEAIKLWANKNKLEKCLESDKYKDKILSQQKIWNETFGITGTPWNILVNNDTGEYEVISWAYPTADFEKVIDELLK